MTNVQSPFYPTMASPDTDSAAPELVSPEPLSEANPSLDLTTTNNTTTIENNPNPKKTQKIIRKKRRPARPQVDPDTVKSEPPPQTGTIFNIWYNKWSGGDREDKYLSKTPAKGRCDVARDSGYTRGDKVAGSYFCLFFAKGLCPKGHECQYLHRLPGLHDLFNPNVDCFGRDKHSDYRDDMGGVGSFMRQNRTLYVGRIHVTDDIEEVVARHFAEWGQIERIRVLTSRGVGFVTYTNEANSQFAKEAMAHQSLDHNEVLNVRWATVDPNPLSQKREARRIEEQAAEAVRRALPEEYVREIEGREPDSKKRKKVEAEYGLEGYEAPDEIWYARSRQIQNGDSLTPGDRVGQRNMIEDGSVEERREDGDNGGILSKSALAALQQHQTQQKGVVIKQAAPTAALTGPLVGYSSDEDNNE